MAEPFSSIAYYRTDHGAELYGRNLRLTPSEHAWRNAAIRFLLERKQDQLNRPPTQGSVSREEPTQPEFEKSESKKRLRTEEKRWYREQLTEVLVTLRILNEILQAWFGSPNWGNQPRVIDELVFILLTRRSKIEDAVRHLNAIRSQFASWDAVADAHPQEVRAAIVGGGLEDEKVEFIQSALCRIRERFGRIDETDLQALTDQELDEFLQSLHGVGRKSSACILMYARDADIFPADTHCIRTLRRLGVYKPLGFQWTQESHKKASVEVQTLIPPQMRGSLHRNLLALGRKICKPRNPLCEQCELRKFCSRYRRTQQEYSVDRKRPTAIDVFSGAGGFSLGLEQAGFDIVAAIDNDPDAVRTYRLNHPRMLEQAVIEADARKVNNEALTALLGDRPLDLLAGGPPCQGFSMMGNRVPHKYKNGAKRFGRDYSFEDDKRNLLFQTMIDLAKKLEPRYVVIENVPGLGSAEIREKSFAEFIAERLGAVGYLVNVLRLEAVDFNIPQRRHRYFLIGVRYGEAIPDLNRLRGAIADEDKTTLNHALFDLPSLRTADGKWIAEHNDPESLDRGLFEPYLGRFGIRGSTAILFNHVSRYNNEDDITLYSHLKEGETYFQLVDRLTDEMGEHPPFARYETSTFKDKYFRLEWEGQSKTIVSHLKKDGNSFVHPRQDRSLSVREAARIQSFPDDHIFCGSRGPQFVQIGNAVPPVMAKSIGEMLLDAIKEPEKRAVASKEAQDEVQLALWSEPEES